MMTKREKIASCLRALAQEIEGGASIPYHAKEIARGFVVCDKADMRAYECKSCYHAEAHRHDQHTCHGGCAPRGIDNVECKPVVGNEREA